jgi:hypothetical protein
LPADPDGFQSPSQEANTINPSPAPAHPSRAELVARDIEGVKVVTHAIEIKGR